MGLKQSELWDTSAYLKRLDLPEEMPSLDYLNRLTAQHLMRIPFEDLDLSLGKRPISLDLDDLFRKIILHQRGGYCFENNKMFYFLLKSLGFDAYPCICRVQMNSDEIRATSHRGTIIRMAEKRYFCDVGFGNSMCPAALELLPGKEQEVRSIRYVFLPCSEGWLELRRILPGQEEEKLIRVCTAEMDEVDFLRPNESTSSPESPFSMFVMAGRLTEDGSVGIFGDTFSRTAGGRKETLPIHGQQELLELLKKEFDIIYE